MTTLKLPLAILMTAAFFGCKEGIDEHKHDQQNAAAIKELNLSDSFVRDISGGRLEEPWLRQTEKYLKLDSLNNGFDSVQIRIWYGCVVSHDWLIILRLSNGKWNAEIRKLVTHYSEQFFSPKDKVWTSRLDTILQEIDYKNPKSGWDSLITGLFNLKILVLGDLSKLNGFVDRSVNDGCGVSIEVATRNIYKYYSNNNPDFYVTKFWQAKNLVSILRFLNAEFGIKDWPSHKPMSSGNKIKWVPVTLEEIEYNNERNN